MTDMLNVSRRSLFGGAIAAGALVAMPQAAGAAPAGARDPQRRRGQRTMIGVPFEEHRVVRVGMVGMGNRGKGMLDSWAAVPGCVITAVHDVRGDRAAWAADRLVSQGRPRPTVHATDASLFTADDVDFVYIATPWEFHYAQGKAALLGGKHVGVELPIATELSELWDLVDTSELTRKHLLLMENCSYGRTELAMLKMAHEGVFGEITNGHGGYLHDLRALLFSDTYYTDAWRRKWHTRSTASLYPMHGLAPIAACMDVNRGDRFTALRASATAPRGLADYRARTVPAGHPSWNETYVNGDLVTCLIDTERGRVIRAEHDVSSPRPYSRINSLAGSRGIVEDYPARVYLEPDHGGHAWQDFRPYRDRFDHWLWKEIGENPGGHGGMDYVLQWRVVNQMRLGQVPDIDVYDSAVWCSPVPLSAMSLADGGKPVRVPDFTRGQWMTPRVGLDSRRSPMPAIV